MSSEQEPPIESPTEPESKPKTFKEWCKKVAASIAGIKDSPHKIALGMGLGLFLGVLPGTGVAAAIVVALLFRANKPAAVAGALAVNTWINLAAFPLAALIGATLTGVSLERISDFGLNLIKNFNWANFFSPLLKDILLGLFIGFMVIGLGMGLIGYLIAYFISRGVQGRHKSQ